MKKATPIFCWFTLIDSYVNQPASTDVKKDEKCQEQAMNEWYKSKEYLAYMDTKLNADAVNSKAKLIELTIQYCGDQLPEKELIELKKVAEQERATAKQIRKDK